MKWLSTLSWRHIALIFLIVIGVSGILFTTATLAEIPFGADKVSLIGPDQAPDRNVNGPAGGSSEGTRVIASAIEIVVNVIRMILGSVALVWIIYSAALLVSAGHKEEQVTKAKTGITWAFIGLLLMFLVDTAILEVLFGGNGYEAGALMDDPANVTVAVDAALAETLALLEWVKGIVIMVAVAFLIFSGFRIITSMGESDVLSAQKNVLKLIAVGVIVLLINDVIVMQVLYPRMLGENFQVNYEPDASHGIRVAVAIIRYFLQFLALVAFVAVLYGGSMWVMSFGDEDRIQTGKKVLKGAAIGIVIILMSLVLTSTFVSGQLQGGAT